MEISSIIPHIEALVFASDKPLTSLEITELLNTALGFIEDQATLDQVESGVDAIAEKYESDFYAFHLKQVGGGWQFLTKVEYHSTVALINGDKFIKKLSTAALETLAIIAYKQPITKSEMEAIRGVNCDYAVQKLLEKDLVIIQGRNEDAVGKPLIYGTSKSFMDYFGINNATELPKISEVLMQQISATKIAEMTATDEDENEDAEENEDQQLVSDFIDDIAEESLEMEVEAETEAGQEEDATEAPEEKEADDAAQENEADEDNEADSPDNKPAE